MLSALDPRGLFISGETLLMRVRRLKRSTGWSSARSMAHLCVTVARASVTRVLSAGYVLSSAQTFRLFRRSGAVAREFPPPLGVSSEKPHVVSQVALGVSLTSSARFKTLVVRSASGSQLLSKSRLYIPFGLLFGKVSVAACVECNFPGLELSLWYSSRCVLTVSLQF
ncbi:hypothetical protein Bca52824_047249 [Brassica carinata]|uniref:Uncharacterized protein n=1 Tax=Brassica carinata TaxID=52824 RepID=A0A8X7RG92_BRACI|nr:hypothetical protein Bca52824_047249 [Brassica carinata]